MVSIQQAKSTKGCVAHIQGTKRGLTSGLLLVMALICSAISMPSLARIELVNEVHKVERFVDSSGRVQRRLVSPDSVVPGDELFYTVSFTNVGDALVDERSVVITNPIPQNTEYLEGSADGQATEIEFSVDQGAGFDAAAALTVANQGAAQGVKRQAGAGDYTAIRWVYQPGLAPGESSQVSFSVRLR